MHRIYIGREDNHNDIIVHSYSTIQYNSTISMVNVRTQMFDFIHQSIDRYCTEMAQYL